MITKKLVTKCSFKRMSTPFLSSAQVATSAAAKAGVRPYEEIPGPRPLPLIGNAWRFLPGIGNIDMSDYTKFTKGMQSEYGNIVKISNLPGRKDMLMIFDPEMIAEIYKNEGQWPERFILTSVKYFRDKIRPEFFEGNQGIVNENGERWQQARTVINLPMMRKDVANQYVPKSDEVAKDFVTVFKRLRNSKMETPDDTKNEFHKWALESISLIALDTRLGCLEPNLAKDSDAQRMIDAVVDVFELSFELDFKVPIWRMISTPTLKKFLKAEQDILDISLKYVEQAKSKIADLNAPEAPDMSILHRILKRDPHTKRAVIAGMDIILAGVDTTSNSTAITLYYLAKNPEQQEKLYQEIKSIVPSDANELITAQHLTKMKYLKACIKEATRLTPVVVVAARVLHKDLVLGNYHIPKEKADFFMLNAALYAQEEHYPQADKFIPERWLRDESAQCPVRKANETHPYVYMPFGHGPRACPGMRFANMEMETLIARLLLAFKFEWNQPDATFSNNILQSPSSPMKYTVLDRS